jgi:hypothetical protein
MTGRALWPAVVRASPGPVGFAVWIAATVLTPLVFFEATHRWEEDQNVSTALWWTVAAVAVLAATVAARWVQGAGRCRSMRTFLAATAAGTVISAVFLAGSLAFYRWIIPLGGTLDGPGVWWSGLLSAAAGAMVGCPIGLIRRRNSRGRPARWGYAAGALVAVAGAFLAPVVVRLGAEDSTVRYDEGLYGGIGPNAELPGRPGVVVLPAAGRYAIMAMGFSPYDPNCRVGARRGSRADPLAGCGDLAAGEHPRPSDHRERLPAKQESDPGRPFVGEQRVAVAVQPLPGPVQGVPEGVELAAHPDALHQAPRCVVGGEADGRHPVQPEILEAEPEHLTDGFGGESVAGVLGVQRPSQFRLPAGGSFGDLRLGPGVLNFDHEVADDQAVALDHDGLGEPVGRGEPGAVVVQRGEGAGEPAADVLAAVVLPRGVGVARDGRP